MTRADVAADLVAERYTPRIPSYLVDTPERCAQRRLVLAEAIEGVLLKGCGTTAGYEHHRRFGEKACDACREARRLYDRSRYSRRRVLSEE